MDTTRYDVVIVGGGAAGLSAATTLGRALRSVLVIDSGTPRNAAAAGVHGYLSRDGMNPRELLTIGRSEVLSYGGTVIDGEAVSAQRTLDGFEVILEDARRVSGRRLLVTTGLTDELPPIDGLREQWGKGVVQCPYCHGWEIRGQRIGVLGTGPLSVHQALLFRQWSRDITFFLNDTVEPTDEEWEKLAARSVTVVDGTVASVDSLDGVLTGLTLRQGPSFDMRALAVGTWMVARSALLESLGLNPQVHPLGAGRFIETDAMGATAVGGVYAAGNVSNLTAQVITAAAEGVMTGARINADLIEEETRWAVEGHFGPFSAASEAAVSMIVLGHRRHGLDDGQKTIDMGPAPTVVEMESA
ncbi:FAD-dependent oxidoreductase [Pseudarthrobacter psychrotolerans]|uniref:FAD-dependent oxidoreductase n=1 Tax=Pseudarthrobacter psychrotolerans TaxID=2697569 RepID=A0A6P1NHH0_9MICC|nr:NAD(P)/FAD-dependent oxidoreductase [Pseudarthrobacter psychrotolerans]QHK18999.1 FAD-dependent oxidoreductase [Pseudarthrobacter psychrotolerans]